MADRKPLKRNLTTGLPREFNTSVDRALMKGMIGDGGSIIEEDGSGEWQFSDTRNSTPCSLSHLKDRRIVNQTAHGFTVPSYGILPVYYDNTSGEFALANANSLATIADALVVEVIDVDNFVIQEGGFLNVPAHGLNVGEWYVLRSGLAGLIWSKTNITGSGQNVQYLAFPVDANNIIIRVDPSFVSEEAFVPQDISILEAWAENTLPVLTAGTNRLLIRGVAWEEQGGGSSTVTDFQVGGVSGTLMEEQLILSGIQFGISVWMWDEADIAAMVGSTPVITWGGVGTPDFSQTFQVLLEHVDQTTPIVATNTDSGTGGTDTLDADVNTIAGGFAFAVAGGGNGGMGFTNNGTGWTRKLDLTITSADGVVDDKLISSAATPENVNFSITGSNRHALVAISLRRKES